MNTLLVEDEDLIASYLQRLFNRKGYKMDVAADGQKGFELAKSDKYDAIILDIVLPKMNGLEVCRRLRNEGILTPIIILSSKDSENERVEGLDAGADDYLVKPFSGDELLARMRALSRRPRKVLPVDLKIGDVVLSPANRKVTVKGKEVRLRPKEYGILEYLLKNKGEAVSRQTLLYNVWGISIDNASNRLDVSVRHLRTKIDGKRDKDYIKTVRGVGYMIDG